MKILALSDRVDDRIYSEQLAQNYGDIDLVIGCGDLPYYYLEYVVSVLNRPLLYVHGNHDPLEEVRADGSRVSAPLGCQPIDDRIVMERGVLILGLGGSRRYKPGSSFQYSEGQMRWRLFRLLPRLLYNRLRYSRFIDLVVTHAPPYGIHDARDPAHIGFETFLGLMRRFRPRLLLHGHTHEFRPGHPMQSRFLETQIANVFPVRVLEI